MADNASSSAGPALRGFRLQILYTLSRLIEVPGALQATLYWPEKVEDLAVYGHDGQLREALQVKAYSAPLTLSDLEPKSRNGLLRRALATLCQYPSAQIRLVSFGPIGEELVQAWGSDGTARERVGGKLKKAGFSPEDIHRFFTGFSFEKVDEAQIASRIESFFHNHPLLFGQSRHAFASLCQWLYGAAERGERVAYVDLIDKVGGIGRYIQERAAHIQTWLTSIIPLDEAPEDDIPAERLLAEFQQGMAAGYRHIQSGCDQPRVGWLAKIDQAFDKASVVIVRGASGQGKSALAYRYLHDYGLGMWRFQIRRIENHREALSIATALSGHAKSIGVPITVYLDVQPGDRVWPELVRALGQLPPVRVLVTVREEDWRRASLSGAEVAFQDIALEFDEVEARLLYPGLTQRDRSARFLDFDEAWRQFGGKGPLLEFVYLVTQTQTLADRLRQQVQSLRDEVVRGQFPPADMRLLAVTAFASSLGARIDAAQARRGLALPDLGRSVERLEREYLLREVDGGQYLDGLHPLRSRLLVEYLCDGLSFDRAELARDCLGLIPPLNVEIFLLHLAANEPDVMPAMLRYLQDWTPPSWSAFGGVFRALLWWGLRCYVDQCKPLITEIRSEFGDGWWIYLDFDLAILLPDTGLAMWKHLGDRVPEANRQRFQAFLDRQPPKASAFTVMRDWLEMRVVPPSAPVHETDWSAIAELSYWCGHWRLDTPIRQWLQMLPLDGALNSLSLESLARLLLGRWNLDGAALSGWLNAHHEAIASRFRQETETVWLEDQDGVLRAHFLIGWSSLSAEEQATGREQRSLHAEAIHRVNLLRGLFPDRSGYGCQGYGHRIFPTDYDDTTKTAIKPENLPPDWAVEVNATVLALAKWDERLFDWQAFVAAFWSRRLAIFELLHGLRKALEAHFRDKHKLQPLQTRLNLAAWESLRDAINKAIPLPQLAVDTWGLVSEDRDESRSGHSKSVQMIQHFALESYRGLMREQGEVARPLLNYLNQALPYLFLDYQSKEREADSRLMLDMYVASKSQSVVKPSLTQHQLTDLVNHLPLFQHEFRQLFVDRLNPDELAEQERRERKEAEAVLLLWQAYLDQPRAYMADPLGQTSRQRAMTVREATNRLDRGFRELAREDLVGRRLRRPSQWNGAPALWLRLDSENVEFLVNGPTRAKVLLNSTIGDMFQTDRHRLALERQWQTVVVVPVFGGRRVGNWVWAIPLHRIIYSGDGESLFSWLDAMRHPVVNEVWAQADIPAWDTPEFRLVNDLFADIGAAQALIAHLGDWLPLARKDGGDAGVLETYADQHVVAWLGIIRALIERLTEISEYFRAFSPDRQSDRPYLMAAVSSIVDNLEHWFPASMVSGHTRLSVSDLEQWHSTWLEHGSELLGVYAALLLDARANSAP